MSTNIEDINTVNDLLNVQQKNEEEVHTSNVTDYIISQILEEDPAVGLEICNRVLYALSEFHAKGVDMYVEQGKPEYCSTVGV